MELQVRFRAEKGVAANVKSKEVGLELVDKVRESEGVPNLPLSCFRDNVYSLYGTHYAKIDEATARRSGHFASCNTITVVVPEAYLNEFAEVVHNVTKNSTSGEIEEVKFSCKINDAELISHWESIGFPLEISD